MKRPSSASAGKEGRPATLADVARVACVGTTTVSRVLNGARYVHPETLTRIQEAMTRLGYSPSHAARALKGERSSVLGLIVPSLRDEFFASLAHDIQQEGKAHGYVVLVLSSSDDAARQIEEIDILRSHRVDGAILVPPRVQNRAFFQAIKRLAVPIVAVDRPINKQIPFVGCDNFEAARRATHHLIEHGRKRILFSGGDPDLFTISERERGYRQAVEEAGLRPLMVSSAAEPSVAQALRTYLTGPKAERPDAIFGSLNVATLAALSTLGQLKLRIPQDVAVMGFDELPMAELVSPPVSVIRQPVEQMGKTAVALLLKSMEGPVSKQVILTCELILRRSCDCAPGKAASDRAS